MLATFCLRLACGTIGSLVLLFPLPINPRFYRTQCLIALGLVAVAALVQGSVTGRGTWIALGLAGLCALLGSLVWLLEGIAGGKLLIVVLGLALMAALGLSSLQRQTAVLSQPGDSAATHLALWLLVDDLTSAALLGTALTAMLTGHSYLIAPAMSLTPLLRMLAALFVAILLRLALGAVGLWSWTAGHSLGNLEDVTVLWLPLRWGLGFLGPLVLTWMAREAAKIRSTQSATGILYVVVIFCFLGELTSQLLQRETGFIF